LPFSEYWPVVIHFIPSLFVPIVEKAILSIWKIFHSVKTNNQAQPFLFAFLRKQ
jgi:hypothetical protein